LIVITTKLKDVVDDQVEHLRRQIKAILDGRRGAVSVEVLCSRIST
jgi:hypothetical protein